MAEATATLEAPETTGLESPDWGKMSGDEKTSYVAELREQFKAEKEDTPPPEKKTTERSEDTGRFVPTKQEETPAESDDHSASDDAGSTVEKPKTEEVADWRDESVRDLAATYGIDDDYLAKIPSRDVLDLVLEGIDKKPKAPQGDGKTAETGKTQQETGKAGESADDALALLAGLNLGEELGADDAPKLDKAFKAMAAELKEHRAFRQQQQQTEAQREYQSLRSQATDAVHKLGFTELFGEPGKATEEQEKRIEDVWQDHYDRAVNLERRGGKPKATPDFLKRSVYALYGEQIVKQTKDQQLAKLKAQSGRRTGGGSTKTLPPAKGATPLERNIARLGQSLRQIGAVE